jgi:hypothetical protein
MRFKNATLIGLIVTGFAAAALMGQDRATVTERRPPMSDRRYETTPPREDADLSGVAAANAAPGDVQAFRSYLRLVEDIQRIAESPTASGIAAVFGAGEIVRARGNQQTIDYFERVLPNVKDPSVARAIRLQLADAYRQSQQEDKALQQFEALITAAPGR